MFGRMQWNILPGQYFVPSQPAFSFLNILLLTHQQFCCLITYYFSADVSVAVIMPIGVSLSLDFESTSMFCGNCAWKYEQVNLIQTTVTAPNNYIFKTPKHLNVANKITYFLLYHKVGIYAVCNKTTLIFDIWVTKSNHRFRFKLKEPNFFHHQFNSFLIFC